MNIILFDDNRENLYPFTLTRPIAEIRWGILTIKEKWENMGCEVSYLTDDYLSRRFPCNYSMPNIYVNARLVPTEEILNCIGELGNANALYGNTNELLVLKTEEPYKYGELNVGKSQKLNLDYIFLNQPWEIFTKNGETLKLDFDLLTKNRKSQSISSTNIVLGDQVFIEKGAKVEASILNSITGPIYIGKNAEIMEGCAIRGPFALCESAVVKMSAKIYGATTIGPHSKVGGEINNSVVFSYSNKGHDGFLGNSILGEWCNLGADTNVSNLKNDYGAVKIWDFKSSGLKDTGQQFCGLMMGDHSKSGINTMFNTGTVVGVNSNIFGADFPDKHIPSFSWGGGNNWSEYRLGKALEVAEKVMGRRNIKLTEEDRKILSHIHTITKSNKKYQS